MTGRQRDAGKRTMTVLSASLMTVGLCIMGMAPFSSENNARSRRYLTVKSRSRNNVSPKINTRSADGNEANPLRRLETGSSENTERHLAVSNPPPASDIIPSEYIVTVATGRNMPKADVTAAYLISTYGGTLMATYDQTIKGFSAILTEAQAAAMALDASVVLMENNYKVYARGAAQAVPVAEHVRNLQAKDTDEEASSKRRLADEQAQTKRMLEETFVDDGHRSLAMWRWNNVDGSVQNWGLDRMSSRGPRNGAYVYFHDGKKIDLYILDTGIHTAHLEFSGRMQSGTSCTGGSSDWSNTVHGTHIASIAGGATYGAGKAATLHPVQVLDMNGEGTMTSVLCGMEWAESNHKASHGSTNSKAVAVIGWGLQGQSEILNQAVEEMVNEGITVVIAAGNENGKSIVTATIESPAFTIIYQHSASHASSFCRLAISLFSTLSIIHLFYLQPMPAAILPIQTWPSLLPPSMTPYQGHTHDLPSPTMGPASICLPPAPPLPVHPTWAPMAQSKLRAPQPLLAWWPAWPPFS